MKSDLGCLFSYCLKNILTFLASINHQTGLTDYISLKNATFIFFMNERKIL